MKTGIIVCGLNGSGKSTLGKALAEKLGFYFIDSENLYFPKTDSHYLYAVPRSYEETEELLLSEIKAHENFVFVSVKGNYGEIVQSFYRYAILLTVPQEVRLHRVKKRSFQKFGNRMLPGGDLYQDEKAFFDMVISRTEREVEDWIQSLNCPIIQIDGTKPIEDNIGIIMKQIQN